MSGVVIPECGPSAGGSIRQRTKSEQGKYAVSGGQARPEKKDRRPNVVSLEKAARWDGTAN